MYVRAHMCSPHFNASDELHKIIWKQEMAYQVQNAIKWKIDEEKYRDEGSLKLASKLFKTASLLLAALTIAQIPRFMANRKEAEILNGFLKVPESLAFAETSLSLLLSASIPLCAAFGAKLANYPLVCTACICSGWCVIFMGFQLVGLASALLYFSEEIQPWLVVIELLLTVLLISLFCVTVKQSNELQMRLKVTIVALELPANTIKTSQIMQQQQGV